MKRWFTAITLAMGLTASAQSPEALWRYIQHKGDSLQKAENLPGLLVGVLHGGQRRYFSFGYAAPDKKIPFDSATLFEAGSITKTLTAFVVQAVLHEKGLADTVTIGRYLPPFVRGNYTLAATSFLSLLNHTSGLPRLPGNLGLSGAAPYDNYTEEQLFAYLNETTPAPNGKSEYSNLGMGLAGVLAQRISGKNFPTLLQHYIFAPFGMKADDDVKKHSSKAQGYLNGQPTPYWNMAALAPAGSWQTTASELLTYLKGMSVPSEQNKNVVADLLKPTVRLSPAVQIAKGWLTLEAKDKHTVYWHNGGTYGFSTFAGFVPGTGQAVVVVANRFNANNATDGLGIQLLQALLSPNKRP